MSSRTGDIRKLAKLIKPYGLTIAHGRKHRKILNGVGQSIYTMSASPSCQFFAENTLHDLIKLGFVPKGVKL